MEVDYMKLNPIQEEDLNLNKLTENFCEDITLRGMSQQTIRSYRSNLLTFTSFTKKKGLTFEDIDNETLKDFLQYLKNVRKVKDKTIRLYFTALSSLYDYLVFEGQTKSNIVLLFRKRYLKRYKKNHSSPVRKLLSIEEMSRYVNSIMDPRDKAIAVILAKTGVRRGELLKMDVEDINWAEYSIILKPTPKRSNRKVFFDDEGAIVLRRWLRVRDKLNPKTKALFVSYNTLKRLSRNGAYNAIVKHAVRLGFHNSNSSKLEDHFGPHCFRHWFTTFLLRNDMPREYVKELRGDIRHEAIDIYHHIDREELRKAYLACIPKLGI
jgi:integrase/recombinase XerD